MTADRKDATSQDATSQKDSDQAAQEQVEATLVVQHDIPPPLIINDSSLTIETDVEYAESSSGSSWHYDRPSSETEFGHIRVLHGNGEMLYQDLYPDGASSVLITVEDDRGRTDNVTVSGGATFRIRSDKKLDKPAGHGRKRPKKLSHPGPGGAMFRIKSIEIKDASGGTKFMARARTPNANSFSEEFRILVWLH